MNLELSDAMLCYRNLLAAEDHLDEVYDTISSLAEGEELMALRDRIVEVRGNIMPVEKDKRFHCIVKHLATAYEAAREVYKVTKNDSDYQAVVELRDLLYEALEKLYQRKIVRCERCVERGIDQSIGGHSDDRTTDGRPERSVQGHERNRSVILSASEASSKGRQGKKRGGSKTEEGSFGDVL